MITAVRFGRGAASDSKPLLVLGPSLGTSASTLWSSTAALLTDHLTILAWDLPGHGLNSWVPPGPLGVADLAADVLALVDDAGGGAFHYAGDSVGGAVGLQLALAAPRRVLSATVLCTGARIGNPEVWGERLAAVGDGGTASLREASAGRWFGPGFAEREPQRAASLLDALEATDDRGYAAVCGALADFDVRARLPEIRVPVLAVAGAEDAVTPTAGLREIAEGVRDGRLVVLDGVAHLAPAERPEQVAALIAEHALGVRLDLSPDASEEALRRVVAEHPWAGGDPGFDRRTRAMLTVAALVALGDPEELARGVLAARDDGLGAAEIGEVILATVGPCGVRAAAGALLVAQRELIARGDLPVPPG